MNGVRPLIILAGLLAAWQLLVVISGAPPFILPAPTAVAKALAAGWEELAVHAAVTLTEIIAGLVIGIGLGAVWALVMGYFAPARRWLLPVLVVSQAVPVFAIAPLLVLWFGYGMGSKVVMAVLIIFFPVTAALFDGLRRTEPGMLDLARTMNASRGAILRHIRIPAALPAFASGVRVATAVAPIGAIVGEWVGSASGLGYLMLHANGRMQVDVMFAALFVLAVMAVTLYFAVDTMLRRWLPWQPETLPSDD